MVEGRRVVAWVILVILIVLIAVAIALLLNWVASRQQAKARRHHQSVGQSAARVRALVNVEVRTTHVRIPGLTVAEKRNLLAKYGGCAYCNEPVTEGVNLHWDHVLPLTLGGANHVSNVVPACIPCNLHKGSKHPARWYAEIGRTFDTEGVGVPTARGDSLAAVRDAECVLLASGGRGPRADVARRVLEGVEDTPEVLAARLQGARDALDDLAGKWRRRYVPATRRHRAYTPHPLKEEPVAVAYRRVRQLERLTNAPQRTIGTASYGRVKIERLPLGEWHTKEAARRAVFRMNNWGVRS
jgi:hypothetical protein